MLLKSINEYNFETELAITLNDNEYMIIIYDDNCSFSKCGTGLGKENNSKTLDELYNSQLIDNIVLKRDWNKISKFESIYFGMLGF